MKVFPEGNFSAFLHTNFQLNTVKEQKFLSSFSTHSKISKNFHLIWCEEIKKLRKFPKPKGNWKFNALMGGWNINRIHNISCFYLFTSFFLLRPSSPEVSRDTEAEISVVISWSARSFFFCCVRETNMRELVDVGQDVKMIRDVDDFPQRAFHRFSERILVGKKWATMKLVTITSNKYQYNSVINF